MSAQGQQIDPVMALAAQQSAPPQTMVAPGATSMPDMDPVAALSMGKLPPAGAQAAGAAVPSYNPLPVNMPQWAIDQGLAFDNKDSGAFTSMLQGPTLGFLDEAEGGLSSLEHNAVPLLTGQPTHFGQDYRDVSTAIHNQTQNYAAQHPGKALAAQLLLSLPGAGAGAVEDGVTAIPKLLSDTSTIAEKAPGLLKNTARGATMGGVYGGVAGFGNGDDGNRLSSAAQGASTGAELGAVSVPVASAIGTLGQKLANVLSGAKPVVASDTAKAAQVLLDKMGADNVTPGDAAAQLRNDPTGQLTLSDLGGENSNTLRLARALVTMPGTPASDITDFMNTRQAGQRGRVLSGINQLAPNTDTYGTKAALTVQRSVTSDPLYQKAFAQPGVGPVDYEAARNDLISATSAKGSIAKQIKNIEQTSPGALAARGAAGADTRANYMDMNQQLQSAEAARAAAATTFQNAQKDIATLGSNAPLTDQRLGDFMADPDIQKGMRTGLNIQRRLALAHGEDFDPNAYAITHYTDDGMPVVGPVPTWQTLHAGRIGLDNMIYSQADPVTGKLPQTQEMASLQQLRGAYGAQLHKLNPALKVADAAWSDPSQKISAMYLGGKLLKADPDQITEATGRLNPETLPYYQAGAGRALRDVANDVRDNNNIPLRLTGDQTARDQITAAFGTNAAGNFLNNMANENLMTKTGQFLTKGSQTANKIGDIVSPTLLKRITSDAVQGAVGGFMGGGVHGAAVGAVGLPLANIGKGLTDAIAEHTTMTSPATASQLAEMLMKPGAAGADHLENTLGKINLGNAQTNARRAAFARHLSANSPLVGVTGAARRNAQSQQGQN